MPIYEFQCTKCNKKFEKILPISSKEVVYCDCSEKSEAKKVISAPSFRPVSYTHLRAHET